MPNEITGNFTRRELVVIEAALDREITRLRRRGERFATAETLSHLAFVAALATKIFGLRRDLDRQAASGGEVP